ncbi:MAG TPA: riboflavin kinase [Candidatus Paceibacterota bacterium]|nr:riboflavin kinase [Candidatus Paceibacterota bacterium]
MRYKGVVQKGDRRGTALGFPTINIPFEGDRPEGIFAAEVFVDGEGYLAVAYANTSRKILEAHLLDFSDDLYDKEVEIHLLKKMRDDKRFEHTAELKKAIAEDIKGVRQYFGL